MVCVIVVIWGGYGYGYCDCCCCGIVGFALVDFVLARLRVGGVWGVVCGCVW